MTRHKTRAVRAKEQELAEKERLVHLLQQRLDEAKSQWAAVHGMMNPSVSPAKRAELLKLLQSHQEDVDTMGAQVTSATDAVRDVKAELDELRSQSKPTPRKPKRVKLK